MIIKDITKKKKKALKEMKFVNYEEHSGFKTKSMTRLKLKPILAIF